jgi:hypothetical protein
MCECDCVDRSPTTRDWLMLFYKYKGTQNVCDICGETKVMQSKVYDFLYDRIVAFCGDCWESNPNVSLKGKGAIVGGLQR